MISWIHEYINRIEAKLGRFIENMFVGVLAYMQTML